MDLFDDNVNDVDDPGADEWQIGGDQEVLEIDIEALFDDLPGFDDLPAGDLGFQPVDPATFEIDPVADTVIGEPDADAEYWLFQGEANGTCAPTSVAMIIAGIVEDPMVTNDVVVQRALELGLIQWDPGADGDRSVDSIDDWSGMDTFGILVLFESFGVDVHLAYGDLDHLMEALDSGRSVTVSVDADEIWYDADNDAEDYGFGVDHQVVVTGIDPVNGVVYLNDPGTVDGQGLAVPLDQFLDAWGDSMNAMIVTDLPDDAAADEVDLTPIAEGGGQLPGIDDVEVLVDPDAPADFPKDPGAAVGEPLEVAPNPQPAVPTGIDLGGREPEDATDLLSRVPNGAVAAILLPFTLVVRAVDRARRGHST